MPRSFLLWLLLSGVALAVPATTTTGIPSVIDGDTLDIRGTRFRLHGIDAPESAQTCRRNGQAYRCGQQVALLLAAKVRNRNVTCTQRDRDRYGRVVAVCRLTTTGEDLNAWLVRQGWAVAYTAYSRDYVVQETLARRNRVGLWAGSFERPEIWRKARLSASEAPRVAGVAAPYRSCAEARAAGRAPLRRGQPGYSAALDRDGDGVACE
ncbi:thermonuclease family protein [Deinococcus yunweiensis]|uniref:thermonuclease family protein n=1 Tax=Deinococcus yunweiensis TaxID=367282 RepID=UPI00398E3F04